MRYVENDPSVFRYIGIRLRRDFAYFYRNFM